MKIDVSTPSTEIVVPTTEMAGGTKGWLHFTSTEQKPVLEGIIAAETAWVEKATNRALLSQTIDLYLDGWERRFDLPRPPVRTVTSVSYRKEGSTAYTAAASTLYLVSTFGLTPFVQLKDAATWPTDALEDVNPIRIRYVAGSTSVAGVPAAIKTAIKLNAASVFQNREAESPIELHRTKAADRLLGPYRVRTFK